MIRVGGSEKAISVIIHYLGDNFKQKAVAGMAGAASGRGVRKLEYAVTPEVTEKPTNLQLLHLTVVSAVG